MRYWDAVFAFLAAMVVAALLTPVVARVARRTGVMSGPSDRGLARESVPLLGHVAAAVIVVLETGEFERVR